MTATLYPRHPIDDKTFLGTGRRRDIKSLAIALFCLGSALKISLTGIIRIRLDIKVFTIHVHET